LIQPRHPRYNVAVGCYLKPLEHKLYRAMDRVCESPTVLKGLNALQRGKLLRSHWDSLRNPAAVVIDMKRLDQHIRLAALRFEHQFYLRCHTKYDRPTLQQLLSWQYASKGFGRAKDGEVRYECDCRTSGDMNTASGNIMLVCSMVVRLYQELGIKTNFADDGDDCVLFCERQDVARLTALLPEFFLRYGFQVVAEQPVYVFEEIKCCKTQPVWLNGSWLCVRDPRVSLHKDSMSLLPLHQSKEYVKYWMQAIGECGMALTGGIPICQDYYLALLRASKGARRLENQMLFDDGMFALARGMKLSYAPVQPETRVSFWKAFGIDALQQRAVEERLTTWTIESEISPQQVWPEFMGHDCGSLQYF